MRNYADEFVRHKKKSSAKPPKKSKHKHDFQHCIFEYYGQKLDKAHGFVPQKEARFGGYCVICGKIGAPIEDVQWQERVYAAHPFLHGAYRLEYTEDAKRELNPETRTLPTFWLDDYWKQKFVELEVEE